MAQESENKRWRQRPHFTRARHCGGRIGTIRKIVQDVDSSTMDTVTLIKQTLQEVFYPQPDNGNLRHNNSKKKDKV